MAKQHSGALLTLVMVDRRSSVPPVAGEGMDFEQAAAGIPRLRLAFTMPSRHHPLGRMLSLARRLRQMEWAQDMGIHGYPPSEYCAQPYPRAALILGFTSVQPYQLRSGLEALAQVIAAEQRGI